MNRIGIIGGSGVYKLEGLKFIEEIKLETDYGKPSSSYKVYELNNTEYYFLARHGDKHTIAPHRINYRANINGFKKLSVDKIISICAVGGISDLCKPGTIVIPDDILDFTSNRESTFFDFGNIFHIDFTEPLCPQLRDTISKILVDHKIKFNQRATYVCTNGPRLESPSEIKMFKLLGADIVGMTLMPEAVLAREAELCYANVSIVTNYAAGLSAKKLTTLEVKENMNKNKRIVQDVLFELGNYLIGDLKCELCKNALKNTKA
ncbi:MAG: S-methyl-5'-thioadenosine phosphorylase [Deferribacterota bacterium]|nr:S-methyl-5'-thioadenosine phosphorylase [Deferribacterota bacterium]